MHRSEKNSSPGTWPSNILLLLLLYVYLYNTVVVRFSISSVGPSAVFERAKTWRVRVGHNGGRKKGKLRVVSSVRGVPGPEPFVFENRRSGTVGIGGHVTVLLLLLLPCVRSPPTVTAATAHRSLLYATTRYVYIIMIWYENDERVRVLSITTEYISRQN